jgi:hypothetical protein
VQRDHLLHISHCDQVPRSRDSIHVPTGTEILISVGTRALPLAGMTRSFALYRSCPAAYLLPLVGAFAFSLSSMTCRACSAAAPAAIEGAIGAGGCKAAILVLASGVGVAVPESLLRGSVEAWLSGAGSITLVRFGRGELGREGGSWVGAGVLASFDIVCDVGVEAVRMLAGQSTRARRVA